MDVLDKAMISEYNIFKVHISAIIAARISSSDGPTGKPVRVRDDPVTVIASKLHDATEGASSWEGAVSVEHKSGDLLILCI